MVFTNRSLKEAKNQQTVSGHERTGTRSERKCALQDMSCFIVFRNPISIWQHTRLVVGDQTLPGA